EHLLERTDLGQRAGGLGGQADAPGQPEADRGGGHGDPAHAVEMEDRVIDRAIGDDPAAQVGAETGRDVLDGGIGAHEAAAAFGLDAAGDQSPSPPPSARRWGIELDFRSIKCSINMDILRCKTSERVRKEIWMHMLADNLIRGVMATAAEVRDEESRHLSFKGAL